MRRRLVDHVWMEEITVTNHLPRAQRDAASRWRSTPTSPTCSRSRTARSPSGTSPAATTTRALTLAYERARLPALGHDRRQPARDGHAATGFAYALELAPGEQWSTTFTITPHAAQPGVAFAPREPRGSLDAAAAPPRRPSSRRGWPARRCCEAEDPALLRTYRASLSDLGALRMHPDLARARRCPRPGCRGSWRCSAATA